MKKKLLIIFSCLLALNCAKAQIDPHFSQIYAYPLWLNPALTGAFDGSARFSGNFKDQWSGISSGYHTGAVSGEYKATDKVSVGLNLINQVAGSANFDYFAMYGTFAYAVPVSSDGLKKLHFGLQVGFINRSFSPGDLQFENQYNPLIGYDPNIASGEGFLSTSSYIFDSGLGAYYDDNAPDDVVRPFGGASVYHINGAADPFSEPGTNSKLPVRFNIHGGVKIAVSEDFDLSPGVLYIRQQQNQIKAFDLFGEIKANNNSTIDLGALYRYNDAIVPEFGYRINNTMLGVSYDINTSSLTKATNGNGGIELSLNYIFGKQAGTNTNSSPKF